MKITPIRFRHTTRYESRRIFRFMLLEDFVLEMDEPLCEGVIKFGNIELNRNKLTIKHNFLWDGNTPKMRILGFWFGVPDFEKTMRASLVHDALIHLYKYKPYYIDRKEVDRIFLRILREDKFCLRTIFYFFVRFWTLLTAEEDC
jgi:hypothetical protein